MWRLFVSASWTATLIFTWSLLLNRSNGVKAEQVNVTIDDTDPSFEFSPSSSWFRNSSECSFCLAPANPSVAYKNTWHHGLHIIPTSDNDDLPGGSGEGQVDTSEEGNAGGERNIDHDGDGDKNSKKDKDSSKKSRSTKRRSFRFRFRRDSTYDVYSSTVAPAATVTASPFFTQHFDDDDPQFIDNPVFLQFNFSGTAIYINCLLPLGLPPNANATPTLTNLTFTLDGQSAGNFLHNGSVDISGFQPNATVFAQKGLPNTQHTLRVELGPDSVFLLDSVVYTQGNASSTDPTSNSVSGGSVSNGGGASGQSASSSGKSHEIATFAGAIGGIVGALGLVSLCLAISIIRRRHLAKRREARERAYASSDVSSFHTFDDEPAAAAAAAAAVATAAEPEMRGPAPFVPRYFPGTIVNPPPEYTPSPGGSIPSTSSADGIVPLLEDPLSGDYVEDVPPPFMIAIASPEPPLLANVIRRPLDRSPPGLSSGDTSDTGEMEEAGPTAPLLTLVPPRSRPPSFRSARSAPLPTLAPESPGVQDRIPESSSSPSDPPEPADAAPGGAAPVDDST